MQTVHSEPSFYAKNQINTRKREDAWIDYDVSRQTNPDQEALHNLAKVETPCILETAFGNLNKVSRNKARQAKYTYIISNTPKGYSHKVLSLAEAKSLIAAQTEYIKEKGQLIEIQGYLGVGPRARAVQYLYTVEGANIAGMQQILSFPRSAVEEDPSLPFQPNFRVVYTPNFNPAIEGGQCILVDLDHGVTYIMGPDYFGESKKAALRMLCAECFMEDGLVLHAGAKEVLLNGKRMTVAILGLSGTGKTTTSFSKQGDGVRPVQDDMVTLWPRGELSVTENGCFAKTFGLKESQEPVIYRGSTHPSSWLENAFQSETGQVDFEKTGLTPEEVAFHRDLLVKTGANAHNVAKYIQREVLYGDIVENGCPLDGWDFVQWTGNGRSIIPLSQVEDAADLHDIAQVRSMGILNRDEGANSITPGIVRFTSPEQAAGYFMLGETTKTSAAGKERGRIRSPFTQPFFPLDHHNQATRFAELLESTDVIECWLMNTGYVAGDAESVHQGVGNKVKIRHSSAMLESLFRKEIVWKVDADFGYEVVDVDAPENALLLEKVPMEILRPDRAFAASGKWELYRQEVASRNQERQEYLEQHGVDPHIIQAVLNRR